eukprot:1822403-Karenia_brevis.AAC.1
MDGLRLKANRGSRDPARSRAFWQACQDLKAAGVADSEIVVARGRIWRYLVDGSAQVMARVDGSTTVGS